MSIPAFTQFFTGEILTAAVMNQFPTAAVASFGAIDRTNMGPNGIDASSIIPTTVPAATFGGTQSFTFPKSVITSNAVGSTQYQFPNATANTQLFSGSTIATVGGLLLNLGDSATGAQFAFGRTGNMGAQAGIYANNEIIAGAQSATASITAGDVWAARTTSTGRLNMGGAGANYSFDGGILSATNCSFAKGGSGLGNFNGTTGVYTATSDASRKENVVPLPSGSAVMALRPVSFTWKKLPFPDAPDDAPDEVKADVAQAKAAHDAMPTLEDIGFIAQDVQKVIPEAIVVIDDKQGTLGINYQVITAHLVRELQDMRVEFNAYVAAHP